MDSPINMQEVKNAIYQWVDNSLDATETTIIWADQDSPRPAYPYVTLKIISGPSTISRFWGERQNFDESKRGQEIELNLFTPVLLTVNLQAYNKRQQALDDSFDAVQMLLACLGNLPKENIKEIFINANISLDTVEAPKDISKLEFNTIISRATMDVKFNSMFNITDYITNIKTVEMQLPNYGIDEEVTA
jgi:hypothetical protein